MNIIKEHEKLKDCLIETFSDLVKVRKVAESQIEISLPYFFNNGDGFDFIVEKIDNEKYIFKNSSYSIIENSLEKYIGFYEFRKNYLLDNSKFKELKEKFLIENFIELSLSQNKKVIFENKKKFMYEIFNYSYLVIRYYNYIYDYFIKKNDLDKKTKGEIFREEINNYITKYNENKNDKFEKIDNFELELISKTNSYYTNKKEILTGAYSKVFFLECLNDLEIILDNSERKNKKLEKVIILYEKISHEYMSKVINSKKGLIKKVELRDFSAKQFVL